MASRVQSPAGAALVEFVIVIPVFVVLLYFGMFFSELVHLKLKVQEVSRYSAFEMTSHALTDFASGAHDEAFTHAANNTREDVSARYSRPASREGLEELGLRIENLTIPLAETERIDASGEEGSGWVGAVLDEAGKGVTAALSGFGFNRKGAVRAEASAMARSRVVPVGLLRAAARERTFFSFGLSPGPSLDALSLKSRYTLVASGWQLPDGRDSIIGKARAGVYRDGEAPTLLYRQVSRMTFLGAKERFKQLPGLSSVQNALRKVAPDPTGTYVVSHNYGLPATSGETGCNYLEGYPPAARSGLNNLAIASEVDSERPVCFDTAPFRDHAMYEESLYLKLFEARGPYFMGCKNAEADDPSSSSAVALHHPSPSVECG